MSGPVALGEGIYWVGAVDWNLRYFHGPTFYTPRGTTYNAYLLVDDQVALVDTVHAAFASALLANLRRVREPLRIDYLVINHSEKDHSGAFPMVLEAYPGAKVLCTERAVEILRAYYGGGFQYQTVKTGDTVILGRRRLQFIEAPMLHWPDSMFTYVPEEGLLLSNDAFGQHLAATGRFDDEVDSDQLMEEAARYYANILMPFSSLVSRKLGEIEQLGLDLRVIAPSHGVIWRRDPQAILQAYARWAEGQARPRAVIAYDTMWQSTEKMALALLEGLVEGGAEARVFKLSVSDRNEVIREILEAKAVLVGSPTVNNDLLPAVSPLLDELVGLKPRGRLALAFGSYGWAGGSIRIIEERLQLAKMELVQPGLAVKWAPGPDDLNRCRELGREIAARIR
ncbi:MAG: FprA family A-type flavoprotein [Moorellales bacterium]